MPGIDENKRVWGSMHPWSKNGDEWDDQAAYSNQPYDKWKKSIVETFIYKNINENSVVLEIAPGHGRWAEYILERAKRAILVDLSPSCIDFCKGRFSKFTNISYFVNDGRSLAFVEDNSIDFIWSYDSFVHMERDVMDSYFREFSRILKPNGKAIIHHASRKNFALKLAFVRKLGKPGKSLYEFLSWGNFKVNRGWRSNISKELIRKIARQNNLEVETQRNSWGKNSEFNVRLFGDSISILLKR